MPPKVPPPPPADSYPVRIPSQLDSPARGVYEPNPAYSNMASLNGLQPIVPVNYRGKRNIRDFYHTAPSSKCPSFASNKRKRSNLITRTMYNTFLFLQILQRVSVRGHRKRRVLVLRASQSPTFRGIVVSGPNGDSGVDV